MAGSSKSSQKKHTAPKHNSYRLMMINAGNLVLAQIIIRVLNAIYLVILIRYLGAELYGYYQYAQNWYVSFAPLTLLGIGAILSRELSTQKDGGSALLGSTLSLRMVVSSALMILAVFLGLFTEPEPHIQTLLLVFSSLLVVRALLNWAKEVFIARESTHYHVIQVTCSNVMQLLVGGGAMAMGYSMTIVAASYVAVLYLEFILAFLWIHTRLIRVVIRGSIRNFREILKKGLPIGIAMVFNRWMLLGPVILFRYLKETSEDLSQIALIMIVIFFTSLFVDAVINASLPLLSRLHNDPKADKNWFTQILLQSSLSLGVLGVILGCVVFPAIIPMLFGDEYVRASALLGPALLLIIPYCWMATLMQVFVVRSHVSLIGFYMFVGAVVMTLLLPYLAFEFGLEGVLISVGIGMSMAAMILFVTAHHFGYAQLSEKRYYFIHAIAALCAYSIVSTSLHPIAAAISAVAILYNPSKRQVVLWRQMMVLKKGGR